MLGNVGKLIDLQRTNSASGPELWNEVQATAVAARSQSLRLRALLQNGANESLYFRRRLPSYTAAVVSLTHLFQASLDLFRQQQGSADYLADVAPELSTVYGIVDRELQIITGAFASKKIFNDTRLKSALQVLDARIGELLSTGKARTYSLEDVLDLANHNAALLAICDEILRLRQIVPDLPLPGDPPQLDQTNKFHWPK